MEITPTSTSAIAGFFLTSKEVMMSHIKEKRNVVFWKLAYNEYKSRNLFY